MRQNYREKALSCTGATKRREMSFKSIMMDDITNVFLNKDEFAEEDDGVRGRQ